MNRFLITYNKKEKADHLRLNLLEKELIFFDKEDIITQGFRFYLKKSKYKNKEVILDGRK